MYREKGRQLEGERETGRERKTSIKTDRQEERDTHNTGRQIYI